MYLRHSNELLHAVVAACFKKSPINPFKAYVITLRLQYSVAVHTISRSERLDLTVSISMAPNDARRKRPNLATQPVDPAPFDSAATQMVAFGMDMTAATQQEAPADIEALRSDDDAPEQRDQQQEDGDTTESEGQGARGEGNGYVISGE